MLTHADEHKTIIELLSHYARYALMSETDLSPKHKNFLKNIENEIPRLIADFVQNKPHRTPMSGFMTGYFEPEFEASTQKTPPFLTPLLKRPPDLVDGELYSLCRKDIDEGRLDNKHLELAYLKDPIEAFLIHIQGSARLRMSDGCIKRVRYAGKTGHLYTAIGRILVDEGQIPREQLTMQTLVEWMRKHPAAGQSLRHRNESYIFFDWAEGLSNNEGPVGAAGIALSAMHTVAMDDALLPYGALLWIEPAPQSGITPRFVVNLDKGSAIKGEGRLDLFCGSGAEAGELAGKLRHKVDVFTLWPREKT